MKALKTKKINKYKNWIEKAILVFLLFLTTQLSFSGIATSKQAYEMIDKVKDLMVQNGYCTDNCSQDIFFVGQNFNGFNITVYGITSAKIINKINIIATDIYFENEQKFTIKNSFYATKFKETGFFKSPFVNLTLDKKEE